MGPTRRRDSGHVAHAHAAGTAGVVARARLMPDCVIGSTTSAIARTCARFGCAGSATRALAVRTCTSLCCVHCVRARMSCAQTVSSPLDTRVPRWRSSMRCRRASASRLTTTIRFVCDVHCCAFDQHSRVRRVCMCCCYAVNDVLCFKQDAVPLPPDDTTITTLFLGACVRVRCA
jgi:hypothetical protein